MKKMHLLIKPVSGNCNMRCAYCFYTDEAKNRETASYGKMTYDTMKCVIQKALEVSEEECGFTFQGGEPTLAGIEYFRMFVKTVQELNSRNITIQYNLQTNGYELDEEWYPFLKDNDFLVGISLDGTQRIHDRWRVDVQGQGTYPKVCQTIDKMRLYQIRFNILSVVTGTSAKHAAEIYRYFKENGMGYQQYIECLDPLGEAPGKYGFSLTPQRYEYFLKSLFDCWYNDMKQGNYVYNRYFMNLLVILSGGQPESCNMRGSCGLQWVIEADGSVYPCDFYVLDNWKLGNLKENSWEEINNRRKELLFVDFSRKIPEECGKCEWFYLCRNGCRRNCIDTPEGNRGKNYYCDAYRNFFMYAVPRLQELI